MNTITGEEAQKHYKEFLHYNRAEAAFCQCGIMMHKEKVVVAEVEKTVNGVDVPTLEYFCSTYCANEWLEPQKKSCL